MKVRTNKKILKRTKRDHGVLCLKAGVALVALGLAVTWLGIGVINANEKDMARKVEELFSDPKSTYSSVLSEEETIAFNNYMAGQISRQEYEKVFSYENKLKIVKEVENKETREYVAKFEKATSNGEKTSIAGVAMVCGGFLTSALSMIPSRRKKFEQEYVNDFSSLNVIITDVPDESQHNMELGD